MSEYEVSLLRKAIGYLIDDDAREQDLNAKAWLEESPGVLDLRFEGDGYSTGTEGPASRFVDFVWPPEIGGES